MTDKEIYAINRALDGKDIYMMPSMQELGLSEVLIQGIKEKLIIKGILANFCEFTAKGITKTKILKVYKEAERYVTINNITIGITANKQNVILMHNPLNEDYKMEYINLDNMLENLTEAYGFLMECNNDYEETESEMSILTLEKDFDLERSLYIKIKDNISQNTIELRFFNNDSIIYIYDYSTNILKKIKNDTMINILKEEVCI